MVMPLFASWLAAQGGDGEAMVPGTESPRNEQLSHTRAAERFTTGLMRRSPSVWPGDSCSSWSSFLPEHDAPSASAGGCRHAVASRPRLELCRRWHSHQRPRLARLPASTLLLGGSLDRAPGHLQLRSSLPAPIASAIACWSCANAPRWRGPLRGWSGWRAGGGRLGDCSGDPAIARADLRRPRPRMASGRLAAAQPLDSADD